ncbi:putative glutamate-5-semialdehyde dehydrogenase, Glutamate 5-kinase [Helianthus annuus]|nr:putative glutamate-5-semialdehyde dehydrogenase, Glutamate 5-kinase [Helianthus annuus]
MCTFFFIRSTHTDCIVTEDREAADLFLRQVDKITRGNRQVVDNDRGVMYTHKDLTQQA